MSHRRGMLTYWASERRNIVMPRTECFNLGRPLVDCRRGCDLCRWRRPRWSRDQHCYGSERERLRCQFSLGISGGRSSQERKDSDQFIRPYTAGERGAEQPILSCRQVKRFSTSRPAFLRVTLHNRDQTDRKNSQLNKDRGASFPESWHQARHIPDRTFRPPANRDIRR